MDNTSVRFTSRTRPVFRLALTLSLLLVLVLPFVFVLVFSLVPLHVLFPVPVLPFPRGFWQHILLALGFGLLCRGHCCERGILLHLNARADRRFY